MILFPIIDWISGFESKTASFSFLMLLLFSGLWLCFLLIYLLVFLLFYESLIVILYLVLFIFIPSYYRIRTAFFYFSFSMIGSSSFMIGLLLVILSSWWLSYWLIVLPFYIKYPAFPFFYWLPEVHCEVNSSISLLLAGLLLKLGLFGLFRFILGCFFLSVGYLSSCLISFSLIGCILVCSSCFRLFDFKKIIAFSSILHLNVTIVSIYSMSSIGLLCAIMTSISHGLCSVCLFLMAGVLMNKTYSRYLDSFFFIDSICRTLFISVILANLSFPGSFNFIGEILSFISLSFIAYFCCLSFLICSGLSFLFWFLVVNRLWPYHYFYSSLNWIEFLWLLWLLFMIFFLGFLYLLWKCWMSMLWIPLNRFYLYYLIIYNTGFPNNLFSQVKGIGMECSGSMYLLSLVVLLRLL